MCLVFDSISGLFDYEVATALKYFSNGGDQCPSSRSALAPTVGPRSQEPCEYCSLFLCCEPYSVLSLLIRKQWKNTPTLLFDPPFSPSFALKLKTPKRCTWGKLKVRLARSGCNSAQRLNFGNVFKYCIRGPLISILKHP